MVLTIVAEEQAAAEARYILGRIPQEVRQPELSRAIIDTIATIIVYKFSDLSRREVEAMLGLGLEESRVYREAKEEGQQQGEVNVVLRILIRRFGELSAQQRNAITNLPLPVLEDLSEALLDFSSLDDLSAWLKARF